MRKMIAPELLGALAELQTLTGANAVDQPTAKAQTESPAPADEAVDIQGVVAQMEPGGKKGKLYCYGRVGASMSFFGEDDDSITASKVRAALDESPDLEELELHVYSPGGSLFEGLAIYQALVQHKANVVGVVDSLAASAAATFLMACDRIDMPVSSVMMVHGVRNATVGGEREHQDSLKLLQVTNESVRQIFMARTGLAKEEIDALLARDSWMSAKEAVAKGFADNCIPGKGKPGKRMAGGAKNCSVGMLSLIYPDSDPRQIAAAFEGEIPEAVAAQVAADVAAEAAVEAATLELPAPPLEAAASAPAPVPELEAPPAAVAAPPPIEQPESTDSTPPVVTASAPPHDGERDTEMSTIVFSKLNVLDEGAACAAIDALQGDREALTRVLAALDTNLSEFEGTVLALRQAAARLPEVEKTLMERVAADETREKQELINAARRERKLVTDDEVAWAQSESLATLRGWYRSAAPKAPVVSFKPPKVTDKADAGWNGKPYGQLTSLEKEELCNTNRPLFEQLRNEHYQNQSQARR